MEKTMDRIREEANKARKIQPKKTSPGYVLLSASQRRSGFQNDTWVSVLQCPVSAEVDFETARDFVDADMMAGTTGYEFGKIIDYSFSVDFRHGYWNVRIRSTALPKRK